MIRTPTRFRFFVNDRTRIIRNRMIIGYEMRVYYVLLISFLIVELQGTAGWISSGITRPRINPFSSSSSSSSSFFRDQHFLSTVKSTTANSIPIPTPTIKEGLLPRLVIIIPAYNEENRIRSTLECYQDFLLKKSISSNNNCLLYTSPSPRDSR